MNLNHLNPEQLKACTHIDGPLLILAGAGSGKTQTMTNRIAYMMENGISPYSILAVTFTNKAAKEMKERVERIVGTSNGLWILTFHAFALRVIKEYYEVIGYSKNFTVYDTVDTKTLLKNIMKDLNIDPKQIALPFIASVISKQKERDINPDQYLAYSSNDYTSKKIYEVYLEYEKRLHANNAMDFDDLLLNCLHILKKDKRALEHYQNRFKYIMVDEYQDTNHIQYEIIKRIAVANNNLAVVGDDDQCIYEWRGADIRNILDFEKDFPNAKVIKLEQNYRSYGNILKAAYSVIKNNKGRKEKKLWTDKEAGEKIVYKRLGNDKEEADYVANTINLLSGGKGLNDYAILYRTNSQSRLFEDALKKRGIPYQVLSGFSFYERKETKDMISYMRLVVNPKDDIAFERIINEPKRGVGPTTLSKLSAYASLTGMSMFEALNSPEGLSALNSKSKEEVSKMVELIEVLSSNLDKMAVSDIYDALLVKTGYMKALEDENTAEAEARIENLLDFKSFIYDYESEKKGNNEEASLAEFLERVSTDSAQDSYDETSGKVTLMTMHSAKGLEFPVVFMPGLEEGLFPSGRALNDGVDKLEEERRLCYVGMTRAMNRLYLTSAEFRVLYGRSDYTIESSFLKELDKSVLSEYGDSIFEKKKFDIDRLDGFAKEPIKPFDPLKYAKQELKTNGETDLEVGDSVTHVKFGHGIVVEADSKTVTVNFDTEGQKKLVKGIAPLKKV